MPFYLKLLTTALETELSAILPVIALLLAIGLATAILQAVLQFEDTAFSLLPKTIAMILTALFGGFGMLRAFENFACFWLAHADHFIRQPWS
jgi:flagellar biosynthesis protein FliQ